MHHSDHTAALRTLINNATGKQIFRTTLNFPLNYRKDPGPKYAEKPPEGILANWIGLLISLFGVLVVFLAATPRFKRLTRPEDEMLLQETNVND